MLVTFWGTRGTIAVPGPDTVRYGGDTSCVSVESDGRVLVLDAGSGVRALGNHLARTDHEIFVLVTHLHADHVMGFPHFAPLWQAGRTIHVVDADTDDGPWSPLETLDGKHFPVGATQLPADLRRVEADGLSFLRDRGFPIERMRVNHPGRTFGFRLESNGGAFVYIPDNELQQQTTESVPHEAFVQFCEGARVLAHDAQFVGAELDDRGGWGHSTVEAACRLAGDAGVQHLLLFHHDPGRTDDQMDALVALAREEVSGTDVVADAAMDGMSVRFG
jgi:ribonuclease BN (tRNA processing enzyme)